MLNIQAPPPVGTHVIPNRPGSYRHGKPGVVSDHFEAEHLPEPGDKRPDPAGPWGRMCWVMYPDKIRTAFWPSELTPCP